MDSRNGQTFGAPFKTSDLQAQLRGLTPGMEYMVSVTPFNARGTGPVETQFFTPVKSTNCDRVPAAFKDSTIAAIDGKTLFAAWATDDSCYEGAEVVVTEDGTNLSLIPL